MKTTLIAIAIGLLLAGTALADDNDPQKLQGNWSVVSAEHHGRKVVEDELSRPKVIFKGNEMSYEENGKVRKGTFKVDDRTKPACINISPADGAEAGQTFPGIYEIDGDTLKLCVREKGQGRPTTFKGGEGLLFVVMKRGK
ncbi:MAG TPA: TIGR03067 domain-containing protein [Gemmataceae bacterium]|nr:TIGR03067 domain-containing protein [Gemmataceae bacterium]